jgi:SAM-dependent methyltransferase
MPWIDGKTLVTTLIDYQSLIAIAAQDGRVDLIDTTVEHARVRDLFVSALSDPLFETNHSFDDDERMQQLINTEPSQHPFIWERWKMRDYLEQAIDALDAAAPNAAFALNFGFIGYTAPAPNACDDVFTRDHYQILIPIREGAAVAYSVYSGTNLRTLIDYVSLTPEEEQDILAPLLDHPPETAEQERQYLRKVIDRYETYVAPFDIGGWKGNRLPIFARGQQTCSQETDTLRPFLFALSARGYLKFHKFDSQYSYVAFQTPEQLESKMTMPHGQRILSGTALPPAFQHVSAAIVGNDGKVYAVDISRTFIDNVQRTSRAQGLNNVIGIVNSQTGTGLPPASMDLVFLSDTYHHFEYPEKMLASIHRALKPGGILVVIDFERIPGKSSTWILGHVRAGREPVIREIEAAGFRLIEQPALLKENFYLRFRR